MKYCLFILLLCDMLRVSGQDTMHFVYDDVLVLELNDSSIINGTSLGIVKSREKIVNSNCTYPEVIISLKKKAKDLGGNLMKITDHQFPNSWTTCHRVTAEVFKVANPELYEKEIEWSPSRRLTSEDFKGSPDILYSEQTAGLTYSGFGVESNRVTVFKKPKFFIYCKFYCYESWIRAAFKNNKEVVEHEQSHFDITEIYARRLLKALTEENMNVYNLQRANEIYKTVTSEWKLRQQQYDGETSHGIDKAQQYKWNQLIANELSDLSAYSRN